MDLTEVFLLCNGASLPRVSFSAVVTGMMQLSWFNFWSCNYHFFSKVVYNFTTFLVLHSLGHIIKFAILFSGVLLMVYDMVLHL